MSPVSWAAVFVPLSALLASASPDAPAYEIDVADVSNAAEACPTQDQLAEALDARMPGVVARGPREPGATSLRLGLALAPDGVARVTMTDATGALRLERDLDLPKSGSPREPHERVGACGAIAETVALIVERYMRHIGYHEPPPLALAEPKPSPAPRPAPLPPPSLGRVGRLGIGIAARPPFGASWRLEPQVTGGVLLGRVDVSAVAGLALPVDEGVPMSSGKGTLTLRAFPVRLAVGWNLPLGASFTLIPALAGGLDLVLAETHGIDVTRRSIALEPTVEAGARLAAALTRRIWIDLQAFQGIDVRPEQFTVMGSTPETVFMTPRTYTRVGVDFGVYLGKN
jgi:hypothetical protein